MLLKSGLDVQQPHLWGLRWVCWTSKSNLSSTTKCDQSHIWIFLSHPKSELSMSFCSTNRPLFVEQKFVLSSSFRCDQSHYCHKYEFGRSLLYYSSQTKVFNNPTSEASLLNKSSCFSLTKLTNVIDTTLVTLCCPTQVRFSCSTTPPLRPEVGLLNVQVQLK